MRTYYLAKSVKGYIVAKVEKKKTLNGRNNYVGKIILSSYDVPELKDEFILESSDFATMSVPVYISLPSYSASQYTTTSTTCNYTSSFGPGTGEYYTYPSRVVASNYSQVSYRSELDESIFCIYINGEKIIFRKSYIKYKEDLTSKYLWLYDTLNALKEDRGGCKSWLSLTSNNLI